MTNIIKQKREEKKLTVEELAIQLNINIEDIERYENGSVPPIKDMIRLSKYLGFEIWEVFDDDL